LSNTMARMVIRKFVEPIELTRVNITSIPIVKGPLSMTSYNDAYNRKIVEQGINISMGKQWPMNAIKA
jgi:uncharacterized Fe-S cluster-containing radical SAM superfamily enzyme